MAINVSSLTSYVEEHKLPILRNAVIGARSSKEMNLATGVKGATALNLLNTTVSFGDGSACGWNEAGTSTLSQRVLTPGAIKINMSFCDKSLLKTWANYEVRVAAGQKTLPFEEDFLNGVVEGVKAQLEKAIWQGDTESQDANLNKFDGMIKIAEAAISTADVVTYASSAKQSDIVKSIYAKIKSAAYGKGEVVIYMGSDAYRAYIQELVDNKNIVFTTMAGAEEARMPESILVPATNVRVIPVSGLDGTGKYFASYRDNFVYGTDMQGDEEKCELWYSQDNREFRLAIEFTAGVQVAFPDMLVEAKAE